MPGRVLLWISNGLPLIWETGPCLGVGPHEEEINTCNIRVLYILGFKRVHWDTKKVKGWLGLGRISFGLLDVN